MFQILLIIFMVFYILKLNGNKIDVALFSLRMPNIRRRVSKHPRKNISGFSRIFGLSLSSNNAHNSIMSIIMHSQSKVGTFL